MDWKKKIDRELNEASNQRKIGSELKKLIKLLLTGNTRFNLLYSSSRETYYSVIFEEDLTKRTAQILLLNGYKKFYLNGIRRR